jgi:hypothetical protein
MDLGAELKGNVMNSLQSNRRRIHGINVTVDQPHDPLWPTVLTDSDALAEQNRRDLAEESAKLYANRISPEGTW